MRREKEKNLNNISEKFTAKPEQSKQPSVLSLLPPELLGKLSSSKPVFLYHSKWGNSPLSPGKIQISESPPESLIWSSPRELKKQSIDLNSLKSAQLLSGQDAYNFLKTCVNPKNDLDPKLVLVLAYSEVLCIVFKDEEDCNTWQVGLTGIAKGLPSSHRGKDRKGETETEPSMIEYSFSEGQYGAVFDISEPAPANDSYREFKVTLIKENTSRIEYLIYDKSQSDLYDSVAEIMGSIDRFLDTVNYNILQSHLLDVTRLEHTERIESLPSFGKIQPLTASNLKFKRRENTSLRKKYSELNGTEICNQIIRLKNQYESHDYGDAVGDVLNLLLVQKLSLSLEIHQLACEHVLVSMRKSLESIFHLEGNEPRGRKSEETTDIEVRISEILKHREASPPPKKTGFRDVCECVVI